MNGIHSPAEIYSIWVENGVKKASLSLLQMAVLGILSGIYIGFGAHAFLLATSGQGSGLEIVVGKLIGAMLFPIGLMLVILCGAELFTGNNLLTLALFRKRLSLPALLRSWGVVFLANLAGSVLLALVLAKSGLYSGGAAERAVALALAKTRAPFAALILRGILCNMLVVLACWMQAGAKDLAGKILGIWFPIMLFVFAGFEHSVANMTYIPLGMFLGADITVSSFLFGNLLPVTLGNLLGGALLIPAAYTLVYGAEKEDSASSSGECGSDK